MDAASNEDLRKMEKIARKSKISLNYADSANGISLLNWCMINDKKRSFKKLLELGADPNWQDTTGNTLPSVIEAARLYTTFYLKLALQYRGNPNLISKNLHGSGRQTPLLYAIYPVGYMGNLKLLVDSGADVNLTPDSLYSPLIETLAQNEMEMAKFLLDHGADYVHAEFWTQTVALDKNKQPIHDSSGSPIMVNDKKLSILDLLRANQFPLNSKEYKIKMQIVVFLKSKGLDYWNHPIPDYIRKEYKNDPEYLLKY